MNCLQCGLEMKMKIFDNSSETKTTRSTYLENRTGDYECKKCEIGFHVMMYNIWKVEKNLILANMGGLRVARNI